MLEARSRAALEKLARAAAPFADVVRDRHVVSVPLEEVVPGDLLVLREGHVIAADGVVRWAANLAIDESSLTGESEPQSKREWPSTPGEAPPDARFFAGSQVMAGASRPARIASSPVDRRSPAVSAPFAIATHPVTCPDGGSYVQRSPGFSVTRR